jgi:uncharacterized membrane protein
MLFRFPILAIAVLLLAASYLMIHFRNWTFVSYFKKPVWLPWCLSAIFTGICIYFARSIFGFSTIIIQFFIYSLVAGDLLNLIIKMCIKRENAHRKWARLYHSGIFTVLLTIIIVGISYYSATHVVTAKYALKLIKHWESPI